MTNPTTNPSCTWCGAEVEPGDGYRLSEWPGDRVAVFCRLEHVVPWSIQGPHWEAGEVTAVAVANADKCAHCGKQLEAFVLQLVRHRGEHRIPDFFCSVDHLADWAKSGGRWGQP